MADATIIVGKLDYKELENSIDKLVAMVADKTTIMAGKFETAIDKMKEAMKDFAITQKVSVDLMKEAWRDMSDSFDAMVKAQSGSGSGGSGGGMRDPNTVGGLKDIIAAETKRREEMELGSQELADQNELIDTHKKQLKEETATTEELRKAEERRTAALERQQARQRKEQRSPLQEEVKWAKNLSENSIPQVERKLLELEIARQHLQDKGIFKSSEIQSVTRQIDRLTIKLEKLRSKQPMSLSDVLAMPEGTLNEISSKMRALQQIKGTLNINDAAGFKTINDTYAKLQKQQDAVLGKNKEIANSNNALGRTFSYIRNRIIYAFTIGAISNFVAKLYEVRGQYEMLERSIGILTGKMELGTKIFNELNEMAIKSPFTLIELGTAAKQLTAYNFAADEVVDTTRRLGDISAALGVPMERLVYNLGQIKAQGVLTARDARDFANAGLAIVPLLAQMYTEQKKFGDETITTAKVYDMMSKKLVTYADVLNVVNKITDEGGKFFNFQERQADALKVQLANLTLAYNNMLNEIGTEYQSALTTPLQGMRYLLKNWREVYRVIMSVIVALGAYKTASFFLGLDYKNIWNNVKAFLSLARGINSAKDAMVLFNMASASNAIALVVSAIAAAVSYFVLFRKNVEATTIEVEMFGESGVKTIGKLNTFNKILSATDETSATYKKTLSELSQITNEYGIELDAEKAKRDEANSAIEQTIELVKEESAARQRANMLEKGQEKFEKDIDEANQNLVTGLVDKEVPTITSEVNAITAIIGSVVQENINKISNVTLDEFVKGWRQLEVDIKQRLRNVGYTEWQINQIFDDSMVYQYVLAVRSASDQQTIFNNRVNQNYINAMQATEATMTLTEKIDANARALRNNAADAQALYNRVKMLVDDFAKTHTINFDVRLTAQQPPKWMFDKSLPELKRLAERFTSIAQAGSRVVGYTNEQTWERALQYAAAYKQVQEEEERKSHQKVTKPKTKKTGGGKAKKDVLGDALQKEIQLISDIQKRYKEYQKMGVNAQTALTLATNEYSNSLERVNSILNKYGIATKDSTELADMDLHDLRDYYTALLEGAKQKNNAKGIEAIEKALAQVNVEITKLDYKKVTDGLNNELSKIKDEYELAVELDANPELGNFLENMFDFDTTDFPKSIDEYMWNVQDAFEKAVDDMGLDEKGKFFDVFTANEDDWKQWAESVGMSEEALKDFSAKFIESKGVAEKWARDIIKQTQDLEYKLADNNGKIAIEEEKLANLRKQLANEVNEKQRHLLELQIQDQENTIARLKDEAVSTLSTYKNLFNSIVEHSARVTRMLAQQWKGALENAVKNADNTYTITDPNSGETSTVSEEKYNKLLNQVNGKLRDTQTSFDKIKEALTKGEDELVDWVKAVELIADEAHKISDGISEISNIADALGANEDVTEVINDIAASVDGLATAAQGAAQIANGDIIGGTVNVMKGLWSTVSSWFDNSDKKITKKVEKSEREVKRLENAYKNLEYAVEHSMGTAETQARRAAIANKQLQLVELERQLTLEKSRKKKNQDQDKIQELEGAVIDAKNDLKDLKDEVMNTLLGSDIKSAAEEFVDTWVQAWKEGETTLDAINEKMDDMIFNLIKKAATSKIVGSILKPLYDAVDYYSSSESEGGVEFTTNEMKALADLSKQLGVDVNTALGAFYGNLENLDVISKDIKSSELSALQQGIQGITEDTASALEAYMNSVSQQVYLHSDLLAQIRDAVVALDGDVQMSVQGQMLLQLQQSYQVQMAIQTIMVGWSNPSGSAVKVELLN